MDETAIVHVSYAELALVVSALLRIARIIGIEMVEFNGQTGAKRANIFDQ